MAMFEKIRKEFGEGQDAYQLLSNLVESHGGVQGIVSKLEASGLGGVARSWVSNGKNLPISADQVKAVLGTGVLAKLASAAGMDPDQASQHIANFLPGLIDKMTPAGKLPEAGQALPSLSSAISGILAEGVGHA
jgi:uncharacterized protein YidB (DUF937 family)